MWGWLKRWLPWLFALIFVVLLESQPSIAKDVTLSWDASPTQSVVGYRVLTSLDPAVSQLLLSLDAGNVLTLTVSGLEDTDDHYFAVTAYDGLGNESVYSNIVHSPVVEEEIPPPILPVLEIGGRVRILK